MFQSIKIICEYEYTTVFFHEIFEVIMTVKVHHCDLLGYDIIYDHSMNILCQYNQIANSQVTE
jgi:hypothetical protein